MNRLKGHIGMLKINKSPGRVKFSPLTKETAQIKADLGHGEKNKERRQRRDHRLERMVLSGMWRMGKTAIVRSLQLSKGEVEGQHEWDGLKIKHKNHFHRCNV